MSSNKDDIRDAVRENYAEVAKSSGGGCCCGSGCSCAPSAEQASVGLGYDADDLGSVPEDANMGLGCGNPLAIANMKAGETVLDLGCGGGLDCFLASKQVGETGCVIGVDMTPDMVSLARKNATKGGYTNVDIRLGEIEHLPVADNRVDVIISNCVINLSPDKMQVFRDAYRVLKKGGRLSISDILAKKQMPEYIRNDARMIASCIGGAALINDVKAMLQQAGFGDIRLEKKQGSEKMVASWAPAEGLENYIASYIIEAVK